MKLEEFIPGFCQGLSRVFIAYPFDFLKTKIQMGATNGVVDYLRTHGIRSVYRGMSIPMVVIPIERSLQWAMFDKLENWK
jgi:hypothetical protein